MVLKGVLHGRLGFVMLAPTFGASGGLSGIPGGFVQPGDERAVAGEIRGFAMEENEDGLADVVGEVGIAEASAGQAKDPIEMSADEIGEGALVAGAVLLKEFNVGHADG